ncbi:MAG TPA: M24 family metallopeptidase, partial [Tissierellaceae bacterium]|nr:M24 family metallopeptidase [Tissierellaceae bacterium]
MIIIKTEEQIEKMKKAGEILANIHKEIGKMIKPGMTTMEIDSFVEDYLKEVGALPEQKGYQGYPYATCASINDEICHGFPRKEPIKDGDIVTIDMVVNLDGWLADSAWSYGVGELSETAEQLLKVTKRSLYLGIEQAVIGNRLGDIGHAIQS